MIEVISNLAGRTRYQRTIFFSEVGLLLTKGGSAQALPRVAFLMASVNKPVLLATAIRLGMCDFPVFVAGDVVSMQIQGPSFTSAVGLIEHYLENEKRRVVVFSGDVELFKFISEFAKSGYSKLPPVRLGEKKAKEVARKVRVKK